MGLFMCDLCGEQLGEKPHTCAPETLRKYVERLRDEARAAENKFDGVRDAVFRLVAEVPSLEGETVPVGGAWLRRLWDCANCRWYEARTPDTFHARWSALHWVLRRAFDVFRGGKQETLWQKLTNLHEVCKSAQVVMGYQDSKLDMTPDELARG